jgi:pimeloyl-ACP methyl ester carboxylesterase
MRTKYSMLWASVVLWILFVIGCSTNDSVYSGTIKVSEGKNVIETNKFEWAGINRVWYYRPSTSEDSLRLVMVLHGMGRNGEDYLDSWIPYADENQLLVVAPEFSDEQPIGFVGSLSGGGFEYRYSTGNVVTWFSRDLPEKDWYFTSVDNLFDTFLRSDSQLLNRYVLFGHSAGGQFVHRMVMFKPNARFDLAIAANSGWYTTPDNEQNYPYGISGAPKLHERITHSLQRPLVVFLGSEDKPDQGGFRTRSEAMEQGESRPQRGEYFYKVAQNAASSRGINLGWQLKYAEGIGHNYTDMAEAAIPLIQEKGLISRK